MVDHSSRHHRWHPPSPPAHTTHVEGSSPAVNAFLHYNLGHVLRISTFFKNCVNVFCCFLKEKTLSK